VFEDDGSVNPDSSLLKVGLSGFRSDEDRRDRWVRTSLFNTGQFPNAELAVTGFDGLPWPLPESGEATFKLNGDLTIQEVTRPVSWDVTAQFAGESVTGQAKTMVTFDQFELSKPTFAFILSVEDEIFLEIDIVASVQ
jgi:polyisoprenoid-binding protein YceI